MRLLIIILTIISGTAFAQHNKTLKNCETVLDTLTNREIYEIVDTPPTITEGYSTLYSKIGILKIPKDPDVDQIRIFISFIVEPNGNISGLNVINKIHSSSLDKELLQLLNKIKWESGTCNGVKVSTRLTIKVVS